MNNATETNITVKSSVKVTFPLLFAFRLSDC